MQGNQGQGADVQHPAISPPEPLSFQAGIEAPISPQASRRVSEHCSSTQTMLEGFSLVGSEQWFSGCFFPEPLEALPKFPWNDKSWGRADSTTQQFRPGSKASPDLLACLGNLC